MQITIYVDEMKSIIFNSVKEFMPEVKKEDVQINYDNIREEIYCSIKLKDLS